MSEPPGPVPSGRSRPDPAVAFGRVADAYDRARPSYPQEAVAWVTSPAGTTGRVLELGAGTGKLTAELAGLGRPVVATDPSQEMLRRLARNVPSAYPVLARAERVPLSRASVSAVLAAQSFHWFDAPSALAEAARVLQPGGTLGLLWNERDERVPWVKRLGALLDHTPGPEGAAAAVDDSGLFGPVEKAAFRFWHPLTQQSLRDLVVSRFQAAIGSGLARERLLRKVDALYEEYGRGADGMLMPYVTHCFRAPVLPRTPADTGSAPAEPDELGTDALLIDFR